MIPKEAGSMSYTRADFSILRDTDAYALLERASRRLIVGLQQAAGAAGYTSVEEFVTHAIEEALAKYETGSDDEHVADQLRGLGYIE